MRLYCVRSVRPVTVSAVVPSVSDHGEGISYGPSTTSNKPLLHLASAEG